MAMYDQDPDVVAWGLDLLSGCPPYHNSEYSETIIHRDDIGYNENYTTESIDNTDNCTIENDEVIAHALQEEFSELASVEASDHLHASVLAQVWDKFDNDENQGHHEEEDVLSSTTSSNTEECCEEKDSPSEIIDDHFDLDGEVEKRLNKMVPIQHVPKINGEIPSIDEAMSDHQRLLERLQLYDLNELKIEGDGNCQFRALSDQFYRTTNHHRFVRQEVVKQLKSQPDIYEGYVPMAYTDYLKKISKNGEWGDHVTLQAAADSYGVKIFVITSFKDTCYIEILPNVEKSKRVIFLSFWAEVHYNSIYPEGDMPAMPIQIKKRTAILEHLPTTCAVM
ncbi:OTU-like cysteine protease family protein, putative, expressed [Zostera marina]|uniref:ubiquitinyl hydrolase 1 n=1 Tax=Zostera marina TaxID=29655 RepID=A0A0K9Q144_ZOSMR|nr:OTU-like cysteine protease family protein, putative, expressed [Zostera marina]